MLKTKYKVLIILAVVIAVLGLIGSLTWWLHQSNKTNHYSPVERPRIVASLTTIPPSNKTNHYSPVERPRIVASLTTIPPRLPKLESVLQALTDQPVVDVIYLNLPYTCAKTGTKYDPLPPFLSTMKKLKVQRCEDYGLN